MTDLCAYALLYEAQAQRPGAAPAPRSEDDGGASPDAVLDRELDEELAALRTTARALLEIDAEVTIRPGRCGPPEPPPGSGWRPEA